MGAVLIVAVCLAYCTAGLFLARSVYGRLRARGIDRYRTEYPNLNPTTEKALKEWQSLDGVLVMMLAAGIVVAWPAVAVLWLAGWGFGRFLNSTPRLSEFEYQDQLAARDRRITQLEREAGIR